MADVIYNSYGQYPPQYPRREPPPPGKRMILVCGIILAISGGMGILSSISMLAVSQATMELYRWLGIPDILTYLYVWSLFSTAACLAVGLLGIKFSGMPERAKSIIIMGAALIVVQIAGLIISIAILNPMLSAGSLNGYFNTLAGSGMWEVTDAAADIGANVVSTVITGAVTAGAIIGAGFGCVLPILYIVGGSKMRTAAGPVEGL